MDLSLWWKNSWKIYTITFMLGVPGWWQEGWPSFFPPLSLFSSLPISFPSFLPSLTCFFFQQLFIAPSMSQALRSEQEVQLGELQWAHLPWARQEWTRMFQSSIHEANSLFIYFFFFPLKNVKHIENQKEQ